MSRIEEELNKAYDHDFISWDGYMTPKQMKEYEAMIKRKSEPVYPRWIPIKWHEITDEEREREGYPKNWEILIDSLMPEDNQDILIQTKSGHMCSDVCLFYEGYILDSGFDWVDDIAAWMPLPAPYKENCDGLD